ncbi:hypothetical protein IMSAG049_00622 [Clostridiales bacterium]|nr:hypothetical protein IMSAG049_00622 [Clostridiales bacterium]
MYPYNINKKYPDKSDIKLVMSADAQTISEMLYDAIDDENEDFAKYTALANIIGNNEDSEILRSISYDEYKHRQLFEEIYTMLVGKRPEIKEEAEEIKPNELREELVDQLFDEMEAVEMYRELMAAFGNSEIRDIIFEIITDEQAHASILNYLINKYPAK